MSSEKLAQVFTSAGVRDSNPGSLSWETEAIWYYVNICCSLPLHIMYIIGSIIVLSLTFNVTLAATMWMIDDDVVCHRWIWNNDWRLCKMSCVIFSRSMLKSTGENPCRTPTIVLKNSPFWFQRLFIRTANHGFMPNVKMNTHRQNRRQFAYMIQYTYIVFPRNYLVLATGFICARTAETNQGKAK